MKVYVVIAWDPYRSCVSDGSTVQGVFRTEAAANLYVADKGDDFDYIVHESELGD